MEQNPQQTLKYSTKYLYKLFTEYDKNQKGYLSYNQFSQLLFVLKIQKVQIKQINTFQDLLVILSDRQINNYPSCYIHQLINSLRIRQQFYNQKQMYEESNYIEQRIKDIELNEFNRRLKLLKQLDAQRIKQFNKVVISQLKGLDQQWIRHLNQFEKESTSIIQQVKTNQIQKILIQQISLRSKDSSRKNKVSKQIIELELKQRDLARNKQFKNAIRIRDNLRAKRKKIDAQQSIINEQKIDKKLNYANTYHNILLSNLKQKISLQRTLQLKQKHKSYQSAIHKTRLLTKQFIKKMDEQNKQLVFCLRQEFKSVQLRKNKNTILNNLII